METLFCDKISLGKNERNDLSYVISLAGKFEKKSHLFFDLERINTPYSEIYSVSNVSRLSSKKKK